MDTTTGVPGFDMRVAAVPFLLLVAACADPKGTDTSGDRDTSGDTSDTGGDSDTSGDTADTGGESDTSGDTSDTDTGETDADGDGFPVGEDCDDADPDA